MRQFRILLLVIILILHLGPAASGQVGAYTAKAWSEKLSDPEDTQYEAFSQLRKEAEDIGDSGRLNRTLQELGEWDNKKHPRFHIQYLVFKAGVLQLKDRIRGDWVSKNAVLQLMKDAMKQANETNDEYLIAFTSKVFFTLAKYYNEMDLAVMYGMYSAELHEKLFGNDEFPYYQSLAEQMYRVREYERCISYSIKFLQGERSERKDLNELFKMMAYNTLALAYHRTQRYDSAMHYYQLAFEKASTLNRDDWQGIVGGNMGQVHYIRKQYDTALALLEKDYQVSLKHKYYDNAANSLQWAARTNLAKGNAARALQQVKEALGLIRKMPDEVYQQNIYAAAADIFRQNGMADSAIHYASLHQQLHDEIEQKINTSSIAIAHVRLNEEKSRYNIHRLQDEKNDQVFQRNAMIAGIVLLALISVLLVNRQRLQHKYRQESLENEKKIIENEITAARLQMELFTQNIIEKTSLIEKLEQQMRENHSSAGRQETISALSNYTILTEDDWDRFKEMFEKIYPLFFQQLKATAPEITLSEQRMAALTRLQLTTRQMATMLGISPDSVHKTRQRLRQRLGITSETNLEDLLARLGKEREMPN